MPTNDFQDWPVWRALVSEAAHHFNQYVDGVLLIPQTFLRRDHYEQVVKRVQRRGANTIVVLLDATPEVLRKRIESASIDRQYPERHAATLQWRMRHLDKYAENREWMIKESDCVIDTSRLDVAATTARLIEAVRVAQ